MMEPEKTGRLPVMGMLAALGIILTYIEIPLPFVPPFMKIDVSDVPAVIGLFSMGLPAALFITAVKDIIHLLVSQSLGIGEVCNFFVSLVYLTALRYIYPRSRFMGWAAAVSAMTAAAAFLNLAVLLPLYFAAFRIDEAQLLAIPRSVGTPAADMTDYLLMVIIPFNLIKGTAVAVLSEFLKRRLASFFEEKYSQ